MRGLFLPQGSLRTELSGIVQTDAQKVGQRLDGIADDPPLRPRIDAPIIVRLTTAPGNFYNRRPRSVSQGSIGAQVALSGVSTSG